MEPIVFDLDTLDEDYQSTVYHPALQTEADHVLARGSCLL